MVPFLGPACSQCPRALSGILASSSVPSAGISRKSSSESNNLDNVYNMKLFGLNSKVETPLYPTHVPLTPLQRAAVAVFASVGALANPRKAEYIATLGETTGTRWSRLERAPQRERRSNSIAGHAALLRMRESMLANDEGRRILSERPRITNAVLDRCASLPEGTFGAAYHAFMSKRGFEADERPVVRHVPPIDRPSLADAREGGGEPSTQVHGRRGAGVRDPALQGGARPLARAVPLQHQRARGARAQGRRVCADGAAHDRAERAGGPVPPVRGRPGAPLGEIHPLGYPDRHQVRSARPLGPFEPVPRVHSLPCSYSGGTPKFRRIPCHRCAPLMSIYYEDHLHRSLEEVGLGLPCTGLSCAGSQLPGCSHRSGPNGGSSRRRPDLAPTPPGTLPRRHD